MSFRPSVASSIPLLVLLLVFTRLGYWQLERATGKDQRVAGFSAAVEHRGLPPRNEAREFTRLVLSGRFEPQKHILADNQVLAGRAGVHVYSPFQLASGETILVNRGWLPLQADRRQLPGIPLLTDHMEIHGMTGPLPKAGRQLGIAGEMKSDLWPQLVTYPELGRIELALKSELYPLVLFLDKSSPGGFDGRDWKPVFMTPSKHRAYAFQWFALAVTVLAAWVFLAIRRGRD